MAMPTYQRKTKLTNAQWHQVLDALPLRSDNGDLKQGDLAAVATEANIHYSTISRLWLCAEEEKARTGRYVSPSRRGRSGRQASDHTETLERLRSVPIEERSTVRSAAAACDMAPTTLFSQLRQGKLCVSTSVAKPTLMEANPLHRLEFSLSHINRETMLFDTTMDTVHVEQKIFYITQSTRRFLLLPDEVAPVRRLRSKRYITRVMFLSAVDRPRFNPTTQQFFAGNLSIWSFVEQVPDQRSLARHPKGTLITKEISVTKTSYRAMLTAHVLSALCSRWPMSMDGKPIVIQQNNASAHIAAGDAAFLEATAAAGCNVMLSNQTPNSPDLNCNDLGLFAAIQARQPKKRAHTIDELIAAVIESYWELLARTINAAFLSLQGSMDDCIAQAGDNNFKPRHVKKEKLLREGRLPVSIRCGPRTEQLLT